MATPLPSNDAAFSSAEVRDATGGTLVGPSDVLARSVVTDTRGELGGGVFVALVGERFDAHAFVEQALQAGAAIVVAEPRREVLQLFEGRGARADGPRAALVTVPDTLTALGDLALFHRRRRSAKVVAIAGSAGKTTTRSVSAAMLGELFPGRVHATRGNLNNRIGVPLTLLGISSEHEFAVVEIGTNLPGEVAELTRICEPDVAILTLIDLEHTEGLGDLDGVEREEAALFDRLGPSAVALGNIDDPRVRRVLEASSAGHKLGYGERDGAAARIARRCALGSGLFRTTVDVLGRRLELDLPVPGMPGALAAAASVLLGEFLAPGRLSSTSASRALLSAGEAGRSRVIRTTRGAVVLDDSYNSNPASARAGIQTASELAADAGGDLRLVLGDMLELGALAASEHRELGRFAAEAHPASVSTLGNEARLTAETARLLGCPATHFEDVDQLADELLPQIGSHDVVLVKASRGIRAERVVGRLCTGLGTREEQGTGPS